MNVSPVDTAACRDTKDQKSTRIKDLYFRIMDFYLSNYQLPMSQNLKPKKFFYAIR